ncbi:putative ABC transporter permease [Clostridioides difficile]|nr:putative ABC transporter permease [Clostridioides difficile]
MEIIRYILYFFIYSFLGWIVESIGCSIASKRLINRGFLNGPICPVYGFGAVIVISLLGRFDNIIIIFLLGMILTTILEYFTGFILETLFHAKWWDYSDRKFNIKGRVCLKNAIYFGIMSVLIIKLIHPFIKYFVGTIPYRILISIAVITTLWTMLDLIVTIITLKKLDIKLSLLDEIITELNDINVKLDKFDRGEIQSLFKTVNNDELETREKINKINSKLDRIESNIILQKRVIKAFPYIKHKKQQEQLEYFKEIIRESKR